MTTNATGDRSADRLSLRPPANRVSPRAVWFWFATALAGWLVVATVLVAALVLDWPFPPWKGPLLAATAGIAAVHVSVMPWWRYRVHRWELTNTAVYTRSGWWTQEWRIAPLNRVQTVDSSRGPVARLFRLTELTVTTASAAGPLKIEGLDDPVAAQLAADITAAAGATGDDAT
ncbi:MAG TPA: PH domain-containing protein [Nakamurella sp.]